MLSQPKANLIRGRLMKRSLHVVSTIGGAASFFVLFLAIGEVEARFRQDSLPLGYWGGAVIAFVVTVALCFVGTAAATWGAGALPRMRLLCCIAIGGAAWFAISIVWLTPSPITLRGP